MKCKNCGHSQEAGKFCRKCGEKFEREVELTTNPNENLTNPEPAQAQAQAQASAEEAKKSSVQPKTPVQNKKVAGVSLSNFMKFDTMLAPLIIQIIFWIGLIIFGAIGIIMILMGIFTIFAGGFILLILGILVLIIGPLIIRIQCELLIIFFKMHESVQDIRSHLTNQANKE